MNVSLMFVFSGDFLFETALLFLFVTKKQKIDNNKRKNIFLPCDIAVFTSFNLPHLPFN